MMHSIVIPGTDQTRGPQEAKHPSALRCPLCRRGALRPGAREYDRCAACGVFVRQDRDTSALQAHYRETYAALPATVRAPQQRGPVYADVLRAARRVDATTPRLLDIGCGFGHFMLHARNAGFQATGIEVSNDMAQAAANQGLHVLHGPYRAVTLPTRAFDVVTMINVLDCLPDPQDALSFAAERLTAGGLLLIRVPNANFHRRAWSLQRVLPALGRWWDARALSPRHPFLFTAGSLRAALKQAGLQPIFMRGARPAHQPHALWRWVAGVSRSSLLVGARHDDE